MQSAVSSAITQIKRKRLTHKELLAAVGGPGVPSAELKIVIQELLSKPVRGGHRLRPPTQQWLDEQTNINPAEKAHL
jgi:hypothetical protein